MLVIGSSWCTILNPSLGFLEVKVLGFDIDNLSIFLDDSSDFTSSQQCQMASNSNVFGKKSES